MNSKNILFIAPIPPPINGQSKASLILLNSLNINFKTLVVNLSKDSLSSGKITRNRLVEIISILTKVYKNRKNNNIIYLSVAESFLGNLRDLFIYIICKKSKKNLYIHLLGGSGLKAILQKKSLLSYLNKYFLKQIAGIIVESENNAIIFTNFLPGAVNMMLLGKDTVAVFGIFKRVGDPNKQIYLDLLQLQLFKNRTPSITLPELEKQIKKSRPDLLKPKNIIDKNDYIIYFLFNYGDYTNFENFYTAHISNCRFYSHLYASIVYASKNDIENSKNAYRKYIEDSGNYRPLECYLNKQLSDKYDAVFLKELLEILKVKP